jgi:hypothetical protein
MITGEQEGVYWIAPSGPGCNHLDLKQEDAHIYAHENDD